METIFRVCTWEWDNTYGCFKITSLESFSRYENAEEFCLNYKGEHQQLFVEKFFETLGFGK
tara:strand:+ start:1630 stop:1812 length:183 start_codon:yes stop_codon:yes gene_type:complete